MTPARGKLLVRPIETQETLPGGKILLTQTTRDGLTAQQAEVVAVGAGTVCEQENCERPHTTLTQDAIPKLVHERHIHSGQWVLLAPRCLVETDTPNLYVCAQDDVLAVLEA